MHILFLIALIWLPFSILLENIVKAQAAPFISVWKKVLFYLLTLPSIWYEVLSGFIQKHLGLTLFAKVGQWFKS